MDPFDLRACPALCFECSDPKIVTQVEIDSRASFQDRGLFVALEGQTHDGHAFVQQAFSRGARYALVKKSYPLQDPRLIRVEDPLEALGEIASTYRRMGQRARVIVLVGSVGKTLVKDCLVKLLHGQVSLASSPESYNSLIGVALSLLHIDQRCEVALVEAAVSDPGDMRKKLSWIQPNDVIVTQITDKYRTRFLHQEALVQEMCQAISYLDKNGTAFIYHELLAHLPEHECRVVCWDLQDPRVPYATFMDAGYAREKKIRVDLGPTPIGYAMIASHYSFYLSVLNPSLRVASFLGVTPQTLASRVESMELELRQTELFTSAKGVRVFHCPYAVGLQSLQKSVRLLEALRQKRRCWFFLEGVRDPNQARICLEWLTTVRCIDHVVWVGPWLQNDPLPKGVDIIPSLDQVWQQMHLGAHDVVCYQGKQTKSLQQIQESMFQISSQNVCTIHLPSLEHNVHVVREQLPVGTELMVMVKAQGYGTDDAILAHYLASYGVKFLGVSYLEEAMSLYASEVSQTIFVLHVPDTQLHLVPQFPFEIGISTLESVLKLEHFCRRAQKSVALHLHVDTGMGRFGCRASSAQDIAKRIIASDVLELQGMFTHFSCAEDPSQDAFTWKQIETFRSLVQTIRSWGVPLPWVHAANTSGVFRFALDDFSMVRLGVGLFGLAPKGFLSDENPCKLAISLQSTLVGFNTCVQGESVGYGRMHRVDVEKARIGVLPIGYYDGLSRFYSGNGSVMIRGKRAPMVGRVCMDYCMVDVTEIADAVVGDPALLFGYDAFGTFQDPKDFVATPHVIPHELVTTLGPRVQRVFIEE